MVDLYTILEYKNVLFHFQWLLLPNGSVKCQGAAEIFPGPKVVYSAIRLQL